MGCDLKYQRSGVTVVWCGVAVLLGLYCSDVALQWCGVVLLGVVVM